ncbi:MAG: LamG domain-containing protein, partial [Paramuribaculum sp.]|nr:LamG domain-containing protein [Paramuribaculum sp.]
DAPIFITIGQSNADGSAFFDTAIDDEMNLWYSSDENSRMMKMWYRSTQVQNQPANSLGEAARWVIDGTTTDVQPGWLDLWYRNENTLGRTAMNMIHGYGTYSVGSGTDCAQGRRGMEGRFGIRYGQAYPGKPLYMIKLGASGSFISSWANEQDDHNWNYFFDNIFRPAVESLLAQGKRPRLAGIWWMQGCADKNKDKAYYKECLNRLIERCRTELGFEDGKFYIGHIVKPGESTVNPSGSVEFSQNVRDAQDEVAAETDGVETIDTKDCPLQYEANFNGYIHYNHAGVNAIGDMLADRVIADGPSEWTLFSTPGKWEMTDGKAVFVPSVGNPEITYSQEGSVVTATIVYPGWSELKSFDMAEAGIASPGYLDLDGNDRFMRIDKSADFDIAQGGSQTVSLRISLDHDLASGELQSIIGNRFRRFQSSNNNDVSGFEIYNMRNASANYNSTAHVYPSSSWSASNINATNSMSAGSWAHLALVHDGAAGQIRYYIDGVQKGSVATKNLALPCYADILVGCRYTLADRTVSSISSLEGFAAGKIDDIRIYSTALSAEQIADDSVSDTPLSDAGVIAAYDFSRISGSEVDDISGNGHTGHLVGSWPAYSVTKYAVTVEDPENGTLSV